MTFNRRNFVRKACLSTAGLCGFTQIVQASSKTAAQADNEEKEFMQNWISRLLQNLGKNTENTYYKSVIKNCSESHYEYLNMEELLKPYEGNLEEFNTFLEKEWGWKIDLKKDTNTLTVNENKNVCVCPLVNQQNVMELANLCYCSEGFAERMFSKVVGHPVKAKVLTSIRRGDDRCRYQIILK